MFPCPGIWGCPQLAIRSPNQEGVQGYPLPGVWGVSPQLALLLSFFPPSLWEEPGVGLGAPPRQKEGAGDNP